MKERVVLSQREVQRMQVLEQVIRGALSLKTATAMLKICYRQAKRLLARYRREGPKGLAHRRRGQPARNALGPELRERVLKLHEDSYSQFNDTHFVEMLAEREGLRIGRETVRRWLREAGIGPKRRRRAPKHRSRRARSPQMGLSISQRDHIAAPPPAAAFSSANTWTELGPYGSKETASPAMPLHP